MSNHKQQQDKRNSSIVRRTNIGLTQAAVDSIEIIQRETFKLTGKKVSAAKIINYSLCQAAAKQA